PMCFVRSSYTPAVIASAAKQSRSDGGSCRSRWPDRDGPIEMARSRWPDRDGPIEMARSRWPDRDRKSTRLNSSHLVTSYAVFCTPSPHLHFFPYTTLFRSRPCALFVQVTLPLSLRAQRSNLVPTEGLADRDGPIEMARSRWPDRDGPIEMARSRWPDRDGPIEIGRAHV